MAVVTRSAIDSADERAVFETQSAFAPPAREPRSPTPWLLGPCWDALLVANIGWPVLLLLQVTEGFSWGGRDGFQFWQLYFLTTPHRWITLAVVFFDRRRMQDSGGLFLAIAAAVTIVCLGIQLTTGTLLCLLTVDYLWNAWHFASQHHGVYRIYSRRAGMTSTAGLSLEKWLMRGLLLFVIVRVAGATWPYPRVERLFAAADWLALLIAGWLAVREIRQAPRSAARSMYLLSVLGLYVSLLLAVHYRQPALVLSLATASAVFHAMEYLSLVTWNIQQEERAVPGQRGLLSYLAGQWMFVLSMFIVVLAAGGWLIEQHLLEPWLTLNVIVAFLHYAYDGLIWRSGSSAGLPQLKPVFIVAR